VVCEPGLNQSAGRLSAKQYSAQSFQWQHVRKQFCQCAPGKLTSRDERLSAAKFAPPAQRKATPAGTNYQQCKLSSSLGQISLAMGRSRD